jgi:hypothetical protein
MIELKKCLYCGRKFRNSSGSDSAYCPVCASARREAAGKELRVGSGDSIVVGSYLLSQNLAEKFGFRVRR